MKAKKIVKPRIAALYGGGQPINEFILVQVLRGGKKPKLDTGKTLGIFRPILGSWVIMNLSPDAIKFFKNKPLGGYRRGVGRSVNTFYHVPTQKCFGWKSK